MISLKASREPFEIELPYGVRASVKPLTTTAMAAAQSAARRLLERIESDLRERRENGLSVEELPVLDDDAARDGLYQALLIKELARRHIVGWDGVEGNDGPADPTPENVAALMDLYPVGERFFQEFTLRQVLLTAAKNGSGLSAAGTSAEGPTTAPGAARKEAPAPKAKV
ncbi:MAG: hypothetical protein VX620_14620 [Pseudomonadota bacterium]|nr:hypothetical protein [Pseudomonadota bacterium]